MPYVKMISAAEILTRSVLRETSKQWKTEDGVWMVWWMQYQVLAPIVLLQLVNLFWYFLIWRVLFRYCQCLVVYALFYSILQGCLPIRVNG